MPRFYRGELASGEKTCLVEIRSPFDAPQEVLSGNKLRANGFDVDSAL